MKKAKFLKLSIISLGLFFVASFGIVYAFDCKTECQPPLTVFSDGNSTFEISFPPGGGTTCQTIADCPKIRIPDNATIFSMKVDMELTNPASEIGTPFIWIPNSGSGTLAQLRTSDGTLVKLYQNSVDGFPASAFSTLNGGISRITVMPGGDVYVGNRGNQFVTRLTPKPAPSEEYEYGGQLDMGAGEDRIRAVTFDKDGNIWAGTCVSASGLDKLKVFCGNVSSCGASPIGTELASLSNGKCNYGMIGDGYGIVWSTGSSLLTSYRYSAGTIIEIAEDAIANDYGIGIDNDANIWIGRWKVNGSAFKIVRDTAGNINSVTNYSAGVTGGGRGIAGDIDNNNWLVIDDPSDSDGDGALDLAHWTINPSRVVKYNSAGVVLGDFPTGTGATGAAIDFDNNVWVVNYGGGGPNSVDPNPAGTCVGTGSVTKLQSDGTLIATYPTCGDRPYNYSDMTGLRTVPKNITVNGTSVPLSTSGTFVIYSGVCVPVGLSPCVNPMGSINCGSADGFCEIPLEIFSMQIGDYTLTNLEVIYGKQIPITTGGLIPCGRDNNDPLTPWDDTDSCNLCYLMMLLNQGINFLMQIASVIAILAFVITGLLFITSSGNPERKNNAKTAFKWITVGFLIIFLSWLFVDFLLSSWGYIDPLGGEWEVVCE